MALLNPIKVGQAVYSSFGSEDIQTTTETVKKDRSRLEQRNAGSTNVHTYPADLATATNIHTNFLVMRAIELKSSKNQTFRSSRNAFSSNKGAVPNVRCTLNLYMPALVENISQNWDSAQHSLLGQFANEVLTEGDKSAIDTVKSGAGMLIGALARGGLGQFNDALQQQKGLIVSDNIVGSYKGPERRVQNMVFQFHPKNISELEAVANIIKELHLNCLPSFSGSGAVGVTAGKVDKEIQKGINESLVTYSIPPVWLLEEVSDAFSNSRGEYYKRHTPRFIFGPAALTNIRMNKTPDQYWRTFKETAGDSASIEIELSFQELFPLDQQTYAAGLTDTQGYTGGVS